MKYLIDDANIQHIDEVLSMGIDGVTANPTMYKKNNISLLDFIRYYKDKEPSFLSAEVMEETFDDMKKEAEALLAISDRIIIKINFSKEGLKLCSYLHRKGVQTAMTLVFSLPQVAACINAGADYIFFFIGRNEEQGADGLSLLQSADMMCRASDTHLVAASIKHLYHLNALCEMGVEYAAMPYDLYMKSLQHPLTDSGYKQFKADWQK